MALSSQFPPPRLPWHGTAGSTGEKQHGSGILPFPVMEMSFLSLSFLIWRLAAFRELKRAKVWTHRRSVVMTTQHGSSLVTRRRGRCGGAVLIATKSTTATGARIHGGAWIWSARSSTSSVYNIFIFPSVFPSIYCILDLRDFYFQLFSLLVPLFALLFPVTEAQQPFVRTSFPNLCRLIYFDFY
jgi:hypothetical protein